MELKLGIFYVKLLLILSLGAPVMLGGRGGFNKRQDVEGVDVNSENHGMCFKLV